MIPNPDNTSEPADCKRKNVCIKNTKHGFILDAPISEPNPIRPVVENYSDAIVVLFVL